MEETESYTKTTIDQETTVTKDKCVKVLGVLWDTENDTFTFEFSGLVQYARSLPAMKRSVLIVTSKIFDPVGFLTPFVIKMKALFQELCVEGSEWDGELKDGLRTKWNTILVELNTLLRISLICAFRIFSSRFRTAFDGRRSTQAWLQNLAPFQV